MGGSERRADGTKDAGRDQPAELGAGDDQGRPVHSGRQVGPHFSFPQIVTDHCCADRNIVHGSDSVESANKEIALWFKPEELSEWSACAEGWVYED